MRSNKPKKINKFLLPLVFLAGICSFPAANLLMGEAKKAGIIEQKQQKKSSGKKTSLSKKPIKKIKKQYKRRIYPLPTLTT